MNTASNPQPDYTVNDPYYGGGSSAVMRTGSWLVTTLLLMIPIVNIILLFVWAFGEKANANKRNLSRAYLLLFVILFGAMFVLNVMARITTGLAGM